MNAVLQKVGNNPVDRANNIVRGVKILGFHSQNGRVYDLNAVKDALHLYENAPVNRDHTTEAPLFSDRLGWIENVKLEFDGVYADFRYNPNAEGIEAFLWFAENDGLGDIGFSHLVSGKYTIDPDGTERIIRIDRVKSVDIVANPATTKTIFESEGQFKMEKHMNPKKLMREANPVKELYKDEPPAENATPEPKVEGKEDAAIPIEPVQAPEKAPEGPDMELYHSIMAICHSEGTNEDKATRIASLLGSGEAPKEIPAEAPVVETVDVAGAGTTSGTPAQAKLQDDEENEENEDEVEESIKNKNEIIELKKWKSDKIKEEKIIKLIRENNLEATPVFTRQLCIIEEGQWAEAIEDRKKVALSNHSVKPVSAAPIQGERNYKMFVSSVLGK